MNATLDPVTDAPPANKRRRILLLIAAVFIIVGALWAVYYVLVLAKRERTDDAYVNGNKVVISAQVSGTVIAVLTDDTQLVNAGQVLVRLDPIDSQVALTRAASSLGQAVRQIRQDRDNADQYDAMIATRKLELVRAQADLAKREPLLAEHAIAPEEVRHGRESVELARAALTQAERQAAAAHALVDATNVQDNPTVLVAKAAYRDAWITAQRNGVVAPVTGYVADRSVQLGQHVTAGQALMTVIPLNNLWVDANFKEVQLRHLRIGQAAGAQRPVWRRVHLSRPRRRHVGGHRCGVRAAAGAKCLRQLDQSRAARAGADPHRRCGSRQIAAARGVIGHRHG
jgi:membrane fusion protein (multidrug efflux system)